MVGDVAARGEDVVRGIVEHDLLGVVDTLGTRHVGEEGRIHIGQGGLRISIGSVEITEANDALLGDVKQLLAGNSEEGET